MIKNLQLIFVSLMQLISPSFLLDHLKSYNTTIHKENFCLEVKSENIPSKNYESINDEKVGQPILIKLGQNLGKESFDEEHGSTIDLTSNLRDTLFPKPGSSYSEETRSRGKDKSETTSTLVFRQKSKSSQGKKEEPKGASSATHPENIQNFKKAGIPIDRMKDPNKKPDDHNKWSWDRKNNRWSLVGELKIKLPNRNIITQSKWNDMIRNHSNKT